MSEETFRKCGHPKFGDNAYWYKTKTGYPYAKCKMCMIARNREYYSTPRGKEIIKRSNRKWASAHKADRCAYERERLKDPTKAAKNRYSHRISARKRSIVRNDMAYWDAVKRHRRRDSFDDGLYTVCLWELEHPEFVFSYKGRRAYDTLSDELPVIR